jgi:uncharacterized protein involved in tolerance to divalent cations
MVNIVIYLNDSFDPDKIVESLLEKTLIAKATVDRNNKSYEFGPNGIETKIYSIITMQTKSMLFSEISDFVASQFSADIPIYSLPITQSNKWFDGFVRSNTRKI